MSRASKSSKGKSEHRKAGLTCEAVGVIPTAAMYKRERLLLADLLYGLVERAQSPASLDHFAALESVKFKLILRAEKKGSDSANLLDLTGKEVWLLAYPPQGKVVHIALDLSD